jgi:hypothetical protein
MGYRFASKVICFFLLSALLYSHAWALWVPQSTQSEAAISYTDVAVEKNGCKTAFTITLKFPGFYVDYTGDYNKQGVIYSLLNFKNPDNALITTGHLDGRIKADRPGKPDLPYVRFQVRIPSSVDLTSIKIEVLGEEFRPFTERYLIAPVQDELSGNHVFQPDEQVYAANEFITYPLEYETAVMHGIRMLDIKYYPLKYNPRTRQIQLTGTARIMLQYEGVNQPESNCSAIYENIAQATLFDGINGEPNHVVASRKGGAYVIVAGPKLAKTQALQDYIAYRKNQGFQLRELIESEDTAAIRNKLQELYNSKKFEYLIIVGDETVIPIPIAGTGYHYKVWARLEGTDDIEDVMMGIFLCSDETTLKNIINHQQWQERGGAWNKKVLVTAGCSSANGNWTAFSCAHAVTPHMDNPTGGLGYTVNRVYACTGVPPTLYNGKPFEPWVLNSSPFYSTLQSASEAVLKYWNEGCCVISNRGHGSTSGASIPPITGAFLSSITSDCSPFFTAICELSGAFKGNHDKNLAYQTQTSKFGTCATIASTTISTTAGDDQLLVALFGAMFPKSNTDSAVKNVGQIYQIGLLKTPSLQRNYYHCWGDPMTFLSIGGTTPVIQNSGNSTGRPVITLAGSRLFLPMPSFSNVEVMIYSLQGKLIGRMTFGALDACAQAISIYGKRRKPAAGMYLVKVESRYGTQTFNLIIGK